MLTLQDMAHDLRLTPSLSRLPCIREKGAGLQAAGGTAPPPPLDVDRTWVGVGVGRDLTAPLGEDLTSGGEESDLRSTVRNILSSELTPLLPESEGSKDSLSASPMSSLGLSGEGRGGEKGNPPSLGDPFASRSMPSGKGAGVKHLTWSVEL